MSKYENAIEEAVAASSSEKVPEELREKAFEVILLHELDSKGASKKTNDKKEVKNPNIQGEGELSNWEKRVINNLPPAAKASNGNRDQQTIWAIVTLYARGEKANTETIRKVIKDELGNTPQSQSNTSTKLGDLFPAYLSRNKEGKKYNYEPNKDALKVFEDE